MGLEAHAPSPGWVPLSALRPWFPPLSNLPIVHSPQSGRLSACDPALERDISLAPGEAVSDGLARSWRFDRGWRFPGVAPAACPAPVFGKSTDTLSRLNPRAGC